ncbi:MAG: glycerol-3-phosphate dehydrogenase/oxidase [Bacteroidota bacterium]|nr:glycerol-3-phosphate dehydrogenase/oxidase [Bacteroidota bacterium]
MNKLSSLTRKEELKSLNEKNFDLIVIGGGMTGAGIALDAASRGLSVALFEKQDFAQGTSSRSTKLVHGGLRYLEHLEFGVVRAVGRERRIVHENAMHIVLPERMILPIVDGGSLGEITTNIALKMYDFLADVKREEKRKMLSVNETIKAESLLESEKLKGGAMYYEYKTDDARLTIEVLKKAVEYGAKVFNFADVTDYIYDIDFKVAGVKVQCLSENRNIEVYGKYVVNATGVWVDDMRQKDDNNAEKKLHLTKGVHIVVPKEKLPLKHSIYFDTGDKRMVFAIPRFDVVYIGTTDTDYSKNYENPDVELKDVQYLVKAINDIAPKAKIKYEDVESAWAGLRPLIHEEGKAPSELSRKDEIFYSESGLISIAGGKLTGYRLMAKKIVGIIRKRMENDFGRDIGKCKTKKIKLSGGEFDFDYSLIKLVEYADKKYDEAKQTGISIEDFKKIFYRYGKNIDFVTNKAFEFYNEEKDSKKAWIKAEVWYVVNYEAATDLADFFIRRTGMIHFFINEIKQVQQIVADYLQELLEWTDEQKIENIANFEKDYLKATVFE